MQKSDKRNNNSNKKLSDKYNVVPICIVLLIIGTLCLSLITNPESTSKAIENVKTSAINVLSPFYLWLGIAAIIYLLYFSFSKYGNIRFGGEKPEYSTFSWMVMMFCAGMGSSLLYWSCLEWIYYYSAPPLGAEPFSQLAAELSVTYGSFHWSITAWAFFAVGAVALAQRYYIKKKPGLSLTACCEEAIGEKRANGIWGKIIEIIFLFGILAGHATTLALGVPMLCNNFATLFGIQDTFALQVVMMLFVTLIFVVSSWIGLEKGLKNLSDWNAYIAIALAAFILVAGPTMFQIKNITNSLGYMFQNFIHMSLWTDPIANGGFTEAWTAFYWAWWLGLGPWMWIFTTKISKGRTMREMILGMIICGSIGCWFYFGTVSNYGLFQQLSGNLDLVSILETQGATSAISSLISSLPFGKLILGIWLIVGLMFLATTMDSSSYTLAAATTKNLGENEHPSRNFKMFWAFLLISVPLGFLFAKASLTALQSLAILTAVPIGVLTIFAMISGIKYAKQDFGNLSSSEITQKCSKL
ncbi:BCCT family transporter [Clostridium sp.]|uniref:BCCT family transporter n=1 Tax=Clostridium sp. TaxID=1506 RepID=UPI003F3F1283